MATKTIAWTTGSGNITLTYTGQGNGTILVSSSENDSFDDRSQSFNIVTTDGTPEQDVSILVKQKGKTLPIGEVFNFAYTGSVQQVTLPKGKYKLQCWGAQGGASFAVGGNTGSKGGYSEGIVTLTKTTTLYVFVGGRGSSGSTTSLVNGGWNGGGASVGKSSYSSGDTNGYSYPACGGGATDISTVTSTMSYSNGRTNRSSASLLARCIVAGGGAGGSWRETKITTTTTSTKTAFNTSSYDTLLSSGIYFVVKTIDISAYQGKTLTFSCTSSSDATLVEAIFQKQDGTMIDNQQSSGSILSFKKVVPSSAYSVRFRARNKTAYPTVLQCKGTYEESTTNTTTSSGQSNNAQQGGGTSGKGQYPGTQTSAGSGGGFGYGANQATTGDRYCSGAGGGGWYGGGKASSDSNTSYVNYSGGGSGFVNTAANASSRPSGYTGLQLDSGSTKDGSTSFESTSGGSETGHSGNGYARITTIE